MLRVTDFFKVSPKQFMKSIRDAKPSLTDSSAQSKDWQVPGT